MIEFRESVLAGASVAENYAPDAISGDGSDLGAVCSPTAYLLLAAVPKPRSARESWPRLDAQH